MNRSHLDALTARYTRFDAFSSLCRDMPLAGPAGPAAFRHKRRRLHEARGYTPTFILPAEGGADLLALAHAYNQCALLPALVWDRVDGEWRALRPAAVEQAMAGLGTEAVAA